MNHCILEYCNFGMPYIKLILPATATSSEKNLHLKLENRLLSNGALNDPKEIAELIRSMLDGKTLPPAEIYLRSEQTYKTILSFPVMNRFSASKLYKKEQKEKMLRDQDKKQALQCPHYTTVCNVFRHSFGNVFNTYHIPQQVVDSLKMLLNHLGARLAGVYPYGFYLQKTLPYSCDYVYFYIRNNTCTLISVVDRQLVTAIDFAFSSVDDLKRQLLLIVGKHEFEFEQRVIVSYGVDADIPLELSDTGLSYLGKECQ